MYVEFRHDFYIYILSMNKTHLTRRLNAFFHIGGKYR